MYNYSSPTYDWLTYTDSLDGTQANFNTLLIITHVTACATIFILSKQMNGRIQIQLDKTLQLAQRQHNTLVSGSTHKLEVCIRYPIILHG